MKILPRMYPWLRKSSLYFGSHPNLESGLGMRGPDLDQISLGGLRSLSDLVVKILITVVLCGLWIRIVWIRLGVGKLEPAGYLQPTNDLSSIRIVPAIHE